MPSESEMFEKGFRNRKAVLGASHVEKSWEKADQFNRPAQRLVTEYCWGEVWGDETLPFRTRSMLNLAMLTAMNQQHELAVHVRGALNNGVTPDEIQAILLQAMVYCGAPAALSAFRTASTVLRDWESEQNSKATPTG